MLAKGGLAALLLGCASPVHAETLKEALTAAYLYNPTLKAAQAQLRSTDNSVSGQIRVQAYHKQHLSIRL